MRQFDYCMPSKIVFRHGATNDIKEYIQGSRVLIISDPFLYQNGTAKAIGGRLTGCQVAYFSDIEPNPSCESVDAAAQAARELGAQTVIGIGGGSSMDVAKIVSCLTTNEGSIYDYYSGGTRTFSPRQTRLICIPTTAGTGSEVTNVGVFTNRQTHVKMPMVNHQFWPDVSMLDPELTYTLPAPITASTGMDAFCHAIEAYWNRDSQPICDCLAVQAMKLVLANIKNAYDHPSGAGQYAPRQPIGGHRLQSNQNHRHPCRQLSADGRVRRQPRNRLRRYAARFHPYQRRKSPGQNDRPGQDLGL